MEFKKRFEGRTGHINRRGNIADDQEQTVFYLSKPEKNKLEDFTSDKRQYSQNNESSAPKSLATPTINGTKQYSVQSQPQINADLNKRIQQQDYQLINYLTPSIRNPSEISRQQSTKDNDKELSIQSYSKPLSEYSYSQSIASQGSKALPVKVRFNRNQFIQNQNNNSFTSGQLLDGIQKIGKLQNNQQSTHEQTLNTSKSIQGTTNQSIKQEPSVKNRIEYLKTDPKEITINSIKMNQSVTKQREYHSLSNSIDLQEKIETKSENIVSRVPRLYKFNERNEGRRNSRVESFLQRPPMNKYEFLYQNSNQYHSANSSPSKNHLQIISGESTIVATNQTQRRVMADMNINSSQKSSVSLQQSNAKSIQNKSKKTNDLLANGISTPDSSYQIPLIIQNSNKDSFFYRFAKVKPSLYQPTILNRTNEDMKDQGGSKLKNLPSINDSPVKKPGFQGSVSPKQTYSAPNPLTQSGFRGQQQQYQQQDQQQNKGGPGSSSVFQSNQRRVFNNKLNVRQESSADASKFTNFTNNTIDLQSQKSNNLNMNPLIISETSFDSINQLNQNKLKLQEENVKNIKGYQPYNYQDYMNMRDTYNKNYKRLGGLGPNIGTNDWQEKKEKHQKINEYVSTIKYKQDFNTVGNRSLIGSIEGPFE